MNTLSWLIYAAEAFGKVSSIAATVSVIVAVIGGIAICMLPPLCDFEEDKIRREAGRIIRLVVCTLVIGLPVYALAPSPSTIYLIAASEAGETVVTSPDAVEIMGDLKAIIKKRLKEELAD